MFAVSASAAAAVSASASASMSALPPGAPVPPVPPSSPPVKAEIINLDDPGARRIVCLFNPKQYAFTKQNNWRQTHPHGSDVPIWDFNDGGSATTQLDLTFDTYDTGEDVREVYTEALWDLMLLDPRLRDDLHPRGKPPRVRFQWGRSWSFDAFISNMTQTYTLFAPDGTPLRANVSLHLTQLRDQQRLQNPTSRGESASREWIVREGDTLAWIAYKVYGRSADWRRIADANHLTNLRTLVPGTKLEVPHAG
jgi:nucleoid-associated protein YgaU